MVYRHPNGKAFLFQAIGPDGEYTQLGTGSKDREVSKEIARMWGKLAKKRAWDLLQPILGAARRERAKRLLALFDHWETADGKLDEIRQRIRDRDIEPLVEEWSTWYRSEVAADSAEHAIAHVQWLLPADAEVLDGEGRPKRDAAGQPIVTHHPRLVSEVTTEWLTQRLTAYEGKRNTRRKVHSSWSGFFGYLTRVHKLWPKNPMEEVPRPAAEESGIRFHELDVVQRIVDWQPTEQRRALFALYYGTGCEVSIAPRLTRRDFDPVEKAVRAFGTKTSTRDRIARIADWAWPIVWAYVRGFLPDVQPWGELNRWTISDWHRETQGWDPGTETGLNLPRRYPLHCARDHWAVRYVRSGGAIQVVASQLGHRDSNLTLKKYGRFRPDQVDRARMEEQAQAYDERRRGQQDG
jgi:integrase